MLYIQKRVEPEFFNNTDCDIEHFMPRHPDHRYLTRSECMICENAQMDYRNIMAGFS